MPVNPADSPVLGALYGTDAMRAVMGEMAFLQRMLDVEAALARAQAGLGIVPAEAATAITAAAQASRLDLPALAAATRNTGYPVVGLVRQLRDGLALIEAELAAVNAGFARMAAAHRGTVMAGRTHLQHALPVTFGYKVAVWLSPLLTMAERLAQLRPRVLKLQFGGAAGTLASLGDQGLPVQAALGRELDLAVPDIPWHVARDGFAEAVGVLGLLCGALSKLATDVILLMQTEVAEVAEPYQQGRGGSSTMPQKRNPISCEYIIAQSRGVHALVPQMLAAMAHDQERGTGPWQAELLAVGQAFLLAHGALAASRVLAEGLVVDAARMRRNLDSTGGLIMAEAVMMGLAPLLGRGEAHHVVNHACDVALAEGVPLAEALARDVGVAAKLPPEALARLTDPAGYLGAAEAFVDRVLTRAR
jgi:3-carboxy-cis,cis-muconate cycloisomerase